MEEAKQRCGRGQTALEGGADCRAPREQQQQDQKGPQSLPRRGPRPRSEAPAPGSVRAGSVFLLSRGPPPASVSAWPFACWELGWGCSCFSPVGAVVPIPAVLYGFASISE